jgi:SOS-response transcriptional repressor LexA
MEDRPRRREEMEAIVRAARSPEVGRVIRERRELEGLSVQRLAGMAEISRQYLYSIEKEEKAPSFDVALRLLTCIDPTRRFMMNAEPDPRSRPEYEPTGRGFTLPAGKDHDAGRAESTLPLPLVAVAAGGPPIAFEEIPGEEYSVLRHLHRKDRYVIKIVGESMKPTFWDQDLLLIEPTEKVKDGTVAVVLVKGESTVKRVHRLRRGGFLLKSDNPYHPPIEADAEEVEIKGKVLRIVDGVRP